MRKLKVLLIPVAVILLLLLQACSKSDDDDDNGGTPVNRRNVKFEVSGNFTGTLSATYVNASGGGTNEQITTALPWVKQIAYAATVPSTGITVGGTNGIGGQSIVLKVFAGGTQISSTPATANPDGTIIVTAPSYVFP